MVWVCWVETIPPESWSCRTMHQPATRLLWTSDASNYLSRMMCVRSQRTGIGFFVSISEVVEGEAIRCWLSGSSPRVTQWLEPLTREWDSIVRSGFPLLHWDPISRFWRTWVPHTGRYDHPTQPPGRVPISITRSFHSAPHEEYIFPPRWHISSISPCWFIGIGIAGWKWYLQPTWAPLSSYPTSRWFWVAVQPQQKHYQAESDYEIGSCSIWECSIVLICSRMSVAGTE